MGFRRNFDWRSNLECFVTFILVYYVYFSNNWNPMELHKLSYMRKATGMGHTVLSTEGLLIWQPLSNRVTMIGNPLGSTWSHLNDSQIGSRVTVRAAHLWPFLRPEWALQLNGLGEGGSTTSNCRETAILHWFSPKSSSVTCVRFVGYLQNAGTNA